MRGRLNYYIAILFQSVQLSYSNLKLDKFRTVLSLSGVSVGLFIVVVVLSLLNSMELTLYDEISKHQGDDFYIQKMPLFSSQEQIEEFKWWEYIRREEVTFEEFEYLRDRIKMASSFSFVAQTGNKISKRELSTLSRAAEFNTQPEANANIVGVDGDWESSIIFELKEGRRLTTSEISRGANVAIIGHSLAERLFGEISPLGTELNVGNSKVVIIGVALRQGESLASMVPIDNSLIIPLHSFQRDFSLKSSANYISVGGMSEGEGNISNDALKELLRRELRAFRALQRDENDNFSINELSSILIQLDIVMELFGRMWWIIAAISLLIGGFGVANIMFVTVKERRSEIGLLRAVGAKESDIMVQFLVETLILTLFGAVAGVIMAFLLIKILSVAANNLTLSLSTIGVVSILATILALLSGFIPAIIASKESPIEAIRRG